MSLTLEISDAMEEDIHVEMPAALQCHLTEYYSLIRYYQSNPGGEYDGQKINMTVTESQKRGEIKFKKRKMISPRESEQNLAGVGWGGVGLTWVAQSHR